MRLTNWDSKHSSIFAWYCLLIRTLQNEIGKEIIIIIINIIIIIILLWERKT